MNIQQNNNSRFLFIPISHRLVTMFIVPVIPIMHFLLCNGLQILSESYQLPLKQSCQYCTSRHIFVWQNTDVACKVQTIDVFSPEGLHSTFWHYKSQPERRKFLSQFKIIVLYSATKIYGTFSSRVLVYSSGRQSKTMTVAHVVLETCGAFLRELIHAWH